MSSAYNIMKSVVAAARACRNAASASGRGQKKRGPKKGSRPGSPMQPHASVAQLLLQEQEAVAAPDAAEQHSDSRYVAQSLEVSPWGESLGPSPRSPSIRSCVMLRK